jgi:phage regulator Rha-like protein
MTKLIIDRHSEDGALVVDSRLIAQELAVTHEAFMKTIKKYESQAVQAFGGLRFQIGVPDTPTGNPPQFVYLTEDQATFLMTLSRNTPEVVRCKTLLVAQFSQAKRLLVQQGYEQIPHTSVYIKRLEQTFDHNIDYDKWSTFKEGSEILLLIEKRFCVPVEQMDLCDGSIGKHWSKYREAKEWATDSGWYIHNFRDRRGSRECKAYQYSELPHFRKWLKEVYEEKHLPKYLADKYGKRAVLQIYQEQDKVSDYIFSITEEKRPGIKQDELYEVFLAAREVLTNRRLQGN